MNNESLNNYAPKYNPLKYKNNINCIIIYYDNWCYIDFNESSG